MAEWYVSGPHEVPTYQERKARFIDDAKLDELCDLCPELRENGGIYVFAVRSGGGTVPIYVGMSECRKLVDESFNPRNQNSINKYINSQNGTLLLFTVTRVRCPGKPNVSDIGEIEQFLIGLAEGRNPDLINIRTPGDVSWSIKGVHNAGRGKPDKQAIAFRDVMGLKIERRPTDNDVPAESAATGSGNGIEMPTAGETAH